MADTARVGASKSGDRTPQVDRDHQSASPAAGPLVGGLPAGFVMQAQQHAGNAAVSRHLSAGAGTVVQRRPADFATTSALALKPGWGPGFLGKSPWAVLLDAIRTYAALRDDQLDERVAKLNGFPAKIKAWETHHQVGVKKPSADETAKISAVGDLRALLKRERRELGTLGAYDNTVDEKKQGLKAIRFKGDYMLEEVRQGKTTLNTGDKGIFVTKVQHALADATHLGRDKVTGTYDGDTKTAVKKFQKAVPTTENGKVDQPTMAALDSKFIGYAIERKVANPPASVAKSSAGEYAWGSAPGALTAGTRDPTAEEKDAAAKAISTEQQRSAGGALPTFRPVVGKVSYEARLEDWVTKMVMWEYDAIGKGRDGKRKPSDLYDWNLIEGIADQSKQATDAVFGKFNVGPALKNGAGLHDAWDDKVAKLSTPQAKDGAAMWRVEKILTGDEGVDQIDTLHGAVQSRGPEKAIVDRVHKRIAVAKRYELIETHKGWPAYSGGGEVYLQRFKQGDNAKDRDELWDVFHTVIHEYLHTLEHSRHKAYRVKIDQQKGGFTLREGVTELFTKMVIGSVNYSDSLRKAVEGSFHDPLKPHPIPKYGGYKEQVNAEKLMGVVGAPNIMAAFFLGDIEKIGGTP